jgi:hypothetical protein
VRTDSRTPPMTTTTCLWGLLFRERGLNSPKPMLILLCHSRPGDQLLNTEEIIGPSL